MATLAVSAGSAFARAGGAGGEAGGDFGGDYGGSADWGSGGSSLDSQGGDLLWLALRLLFSPAIPWPVRVGLLAVLAGAGYAFFRLADRSQKRRQWPASRGGYGGGLPSERTRSGEGGISLDFPALADDPFLIKAQKAFRDIQDGWSRGDLSACRRFLSDGVHRRFSAQLEMMASLSLRNRVSDLRLLGLRETSAAEDGPFETRTVIFRARARDRWESPLPGLKLGGGEETFSEAWTFLRRREEPKRAVGSDPFADGTAAAPVDLFNDVTCPACRAPLDKDLGEACLCPYCATVLNTGEFDWVLSEITQEEHSREKRPGPPPEARQELQRAFPEFSRQECEDKAGNAFLQILLAEATGKPERARHFCTDAAWDALRAGAEDTPFAYDRLFLEEVSWTDILPLGTAPKSGGDPFWRLRCRLALAYRRVRVEQGQARYLDTDLQRATVLLSLRRRAGSVRAAGKLYAHQCPACGAPVQDRLEADCAYCGAPLNDGSREWVVESLTGLPGRAPHPPGRDRVSDPDGAPGQTGSAAAKASAESADEAFARMKRSLFG